MTKPNNERKKTDANWSATLDCECPYCDEWVNVAIGLNDFFGPDQPVGVLESKKDVPFTCPECKKTFNADVWW